eukprot:jgi/Tetstr1/425964/TSEL_016314.t1
METAKGRGRPSSGGLARRHTARSDLAPLRNAPKLRSARVMRMWLPLLVGFAFAAVVFYYRMEFQRAMMPGPSRLYGNLEPEATPEPTATPEPADGANVVPDLEVIEAVTGAPAQPEPEPQAEPQPEPESEPEPESDPAPEPAPTPEPSVQRRSMPRTAEAPTMAPMQEPQQSAAAAGRQPVTVNKPTFAAAARKSSSAGGSSGLAGDLLDGTGGQPEAEPAYYEINDAMSAYLANAGIMFGLVYAFIFGRSYTRFDSMTDTFYAEVSAIHKLVLLVQTVSVEPEAITAMLESLEHYTSQCRYEMTTGVMCYENEQVEVMTKLYAIVPALQHVVQRKDHDDSRAYAQLSGAISEVMLSTIGELCNLRYQRWSQSQKHIPVILWAFITLSSMLMFWGVMMMQSGWANLDITLCALTVVGICIMIYCLADVDQTHTGLMRIPVDRLDELNFMGKPLFTSGANVNARLLAINRVAPAMRLSAGWMTSVTRKGSTEHLPTHSVPEDDEITALQNPQQPGAFAVERLKRIPGTKSTRTNSLVTAVEKFSTYPLVADSAREASGST